MEAIISSESLEASYNNTELYKTGWSGFYADHSEKLKS